jgi:S-formylglutathione hydrolase FrmB
LHGPSNSQSEIIRVEHESHALADNPLGDPSLRWLPIYLPPGYQDDVARRYPVLWLLSGFSSWGERMLNLSAWDENIQQMPPVIAALPDCFTRYGGSQYINSTPVGRYEDYLVEELVPLVDGQFRTLPDAAHRGVAGKSSGGYGALVLGMRQPGVFGGVACHSGDMLFEYAYRTEFPDFVNGLAKYGGEPEAFLAVFDKVVPHERGTQWHATINTLAMSACYSPNPDSPLGFDLPCDTYTGEIVPEVWERWLAWDPVNMVDRHAEALRGLRCLYIDCGRRDEFHLHLGARMMARKLTEHGIAHQHEEFDAGHMDIGHRYDVSLPILAKALSPEVG